MTTVDGWDNDSGVTAGVAEPFNQNLSYARLLKAEQSENLKLNVESQLRNKGVDLNSIAGTSYADVNTRVVATVPTFAYGVTEKWTLAIAVPIVYTNLDIETGFVGSPELQTLVSDFSEKSRKQTGLIESKLRDVIATEIANKGYKPLQDEERTQVGDLTFVAKYLAYQDLNVSWAISNRFVFPTAKVRDVNRVIDPAAGDGQFDWGIDSTVVIPVNAKINLIQQTGYTFQFGDTFETRIPLSEEERLSTDVDYAANRDLGDMMYTSFGAQVSPNQSLSFAASYTMAYKERDRWSGSVASADRYDVLGVETEQFMQAFYLQTAVSSISAFKKKRFPIPLTATFGVGKVTDGRNVRNDPVWSFNMSMFF
ncbi:MAG: transporter [Bdellovibrionales bacterium]|nr:transporter [Bdellovibrionales bacterium]